VTVETTLTAELPPLSVDSEQVSQALGNLIKNAIEAMPDGGTLRISTELIDDKKVQIKIQDTGAGMSPETLEKLFTPYYTTKATGTGLGMAIVQRIITDHDGEISVESEEGVGTTFWIVLPSEGTDGT
jgi:signal transduction histidine kinase